MLNQFSRTQLLLGQDGMERLYNARVAVFGIGGVGGYTVEALVRSGVGTLDLIDDDRVCLTNVNRQIFATRKTVGQYKADVAEERIKEINPNAVVHTYKTFYAPQTADQFDFTQYDYIVDAIDTVTGKLELIDIIRGPLESAPRMIRFSRNGEYAYILYELLNIVEVYHYSVQDNEPVFEKIQTISTSPKKEEDTCAASGMEISKSGKYLFCSNAGVNSVVCYEIEEKTGMLTPVFTTKVNSDYPKMLAIYPDEKHYLTLNNNSNDIFSYTIDYKDGYSLETGSPVKVDKPNCIYMLKLEVE